MALTGSRLRWPGVDKDRARAALWHIERGAVALLELDPSRSDEAELLEKRRQEHLRLARGYLGAIGFESSERLERREPKGL